MKKVNEGKRTEGNVASQLTCFLFVVSSSRMSTLLTPLLVPNPARHNERGDKRKERKKKKSREILFAVVNSHFLCCAFSRFCVFLRVPVVHAELKNKEIIKFS